MTQVSPAWKFMADIPLLKLQRLQNGVLCTTGKFPPYTKLQAACGFNIPYVSDFSTKLCR
jgi:hypothetical protein